MYQIERIFSDFENFISDSSKLNKKSEHILRIDIRLQLEGNSKISLTNFGAIITRLPKGIGIEGINRGG